METEGPLSGQTLGGKYLLGELLGGGGFGAVYRGHHHLLDRPQAIKVLHEHYFRKPEFRERFLREAKIVAALDHPHIVHIDDFGMDEQETRAYLVMPFISERTFFENLKGQRQPLPVEQVLLYLEQICSALDYAHQRGVVHLDLKPLNLLIREDNWLLLSDFGLAHFLKQEAVEGGTSLGYGSPHYMAPEHIKGLPNKSSDVYALGIILFEMLVGQRPFTGTTPESIMLKHLTEPPPLLRSLRPELPIELEEVLGRALAKQTEQRFRSAGALLNAFKEALAHVEEQKLKAEMEEQRKIEEERARKTEEERLLRAKEVQALRAEIERLQRTEQERAHRAEEERMQRAKEEQALRAEIERLQRAEEARVHKAEEERLLRAETTASPQGPTPPSGQTFNEEEDHFSELPPPSIPIQVPQTPMQVPQAIPQPIVLQAQPKLLASTSKPPLTRTTRKMLQQAPTQKPSGPLTTRSGSRAPQPAGSRPASQPIRQYTSPARPKSTLGTRMRQPAARNRSGRPRRLYLILASIAALFVLLFAIVYLNTSSTIKAIVTTQDYTHPVTLTLSNKNQSDTVPATLMTHSFPKTSLEPATGSTTRATNQANGSVLFTNTGTTNVVIPSQIIVATTKNVDFVTTQNALILPQSEHPTPLPVAVVAKNPGVSGNVPAGSITVIPADSLTSIAQAQTPPVTPASLQTTLTVTNPDATTGGEAAYVTQQDLDNAKKDLDTQVQADLSAWVQQLAKNRLVGQPVLTNDTLIGPPGTDTPEPDGTFSASINVTATVLVATLNDAQTIATKQLNNTVQADQQFGSTDAIIGAINLDLTRQNASNRNTVTAPAIGKVGPNLKGVQNSITGKSFNEARTILRQKSRQRILTVDIQTWPGIFNWVSPWADHITVIILAAPSA